MNRLDCVISYFFQLYLMLRACVRKLDVMGSVKKKVWKLNAALDFRHRVSEEHLFF